jgi:hypothetical protein
MADKQRQAVNESRRAFLMLRGGRYTAIVPLLLALAISRPAVADWRFTKWGMTPEQVVAASQGKVHMLPPNLRPRVPRLETVAAGDFKDNELDLETRYAFSAAGGGLACVFYAVASKDDNEAFKASLTKQFGAPQKTSELPMISMKKMSWVTATDSVDASFSGDDAGFVLQCKR